MSLGCGEGEPVLGLCSKSLSTGSQTISASAVLGNHSRTSLPLSSYIPFHSNSHFHHLQPDLVAPGAMITSAAGGQTCGTVQTEGTSVAAAHVAGAAAIVRQYFRDGYYPRYQQTGEGRGGVGANTRMGVGCSVLLPSQSLALLSYLRPPSPFFPTHTLFRMQRGCPPGRQFDAFVGAAEGGADRVRGAADRPRLCWHCPLRSSRLHARLWCATDNFWAGAG